MNLFKLKKDGKTVGYFKFDWCDWGDCSKKVKHMGVQFSEDGLKWLDLFGDLTYDAIHPYVCLDKNGDKVFSGDKVIYRSPDLDELCEDEENEELEASVAGGFLIYDVEGTDFVEASKFGDIELIKDKTENVEG